MNFLRKKVAVLVVIFLFCSGTAFAKRGQTTPLKTIATTSDLAALLKEIGGNTVTVECLADGGRDPHSVEPDSSFVLKLMEADLLVANGMELEISWLPISIESSANQRIQPGSIGFLDASKSIAAFDLPNNLNKDSDNDHPVGNPHYLLDPENARKVAAAIKDRLIALSPHQSRIIDRNFNNFDQRLQQKIRQWKMVLSPYRGYRFVSYHKTYPYFAARFGLINVGTIEPKAGVPPTAKHDAEVVDQMRAQNVSMIWAEPWDENDDAKLIAKKTDAKVLLLNGMPTSSGKTSDYISTLDKMVTTIAKTLKDSPQRYYDLADSNP